MSLYDDHISYAKKTRIPIRLANIWCDKQLEIQKEMEKAKICPSCGEPTLTLESGDYFEGTRDYVYCENDEIYSVDEEGEPYFTECDYVTSPEKEHEPLSTWYDFDIIWAFACGMADREKEYPSLQSWLDFVRNEVEKAPIKVPA